MDKEFDEVDIWLGRFRSREAAEAYFEEQYLDDDEAISEFVKDQGQSYIDHDFMEREYHDPPTNDFRRALAWHSFSASYIEQASAAFQDRPFEPFDTVLLVWGNEVRVPVSVSRDQVELHYVGHFESNPDAGNWSEDP